jgi:cell division protein FtsB
MSLHSCRKFFEDNLRRTSARSDPTTYNLNAGLLEMVKSLEAELQQLRAEHVVLSQQIASLQRR